MTKETNGKLNHWSSQFTFVMAAVGSAVGLGNFWRFPYETGVNGGGAFVIVYLGCILLVVIPLVVGELFIGRRGGMSAVGSARKVAKEQNATGGWSIIGWSGMLAAFLVLSFYSVVAGWIIAYIPKMMMGGFTGADAESTGLIFGNLLASPLTLIFCHTLFMALTIVIVIRGLKRGIELAVNILMPLFLALLMAMCVYSAFFVGDFAAGFNFMFDADFSKITPEVALAAFGHAFFSVGVGVGIMLTYGAYLEKDTNIQKSAIIIGLSDTAVAITAGLVIFPIVFAYGLDPAAGPGLLFVTLPIAFGQMPFGAAFGTIFLFLGLVAAITSSISMLEIGVSWAEEHKGFKRSKSALSVGFAAWTVGLLTVFSFNEAASFYPLGMFEVFHEKTMYDIIDYVQGKILLPLGGFLIAIFVGWVVSRETILEELDWKDGTSFRIWRFLVRIVAPITVAGILLAQLGVI